MKFIPLRRGFSIRKDEIIGVEDTSDGTTFMTKIHTRSGKVYQGNINYKAVLDLLEQQETLPISQFAQHNAG